MKRKYSQAAHAKRDMRDAYILGMTEDEQAQDALESIDHYEPVYEASANHHLDDEATPF